MEITKDVKYIGVSDLDIDLFEGQYKVDGITYNSYLILDDKICVMDTVDNNFKNQWLENLEKELNGRRPSYLVIHHMEMDHSSIIKEFMDKYKEAIIVSSLMAFNMMKKIFNDDYSSRRIVIKEGDILDLGKHKLKFISAAMVHWPEVMFSYDLEDKILFSADGFGKFSISNDSSWIEEARRYYFNIVGKFGLNVQNVLKKAASLDIKIICPLHGPILKDNLSYYINLYSLWSSYSFEEDGVTICYSSVYGNTKKAIEFLESNLKKNNIKYALYDLARCDHSKALSDAFKYSKLILATTTYNNDIFPVMKDFIFSLIDHNYQKRTIGLIENGMWAPSANKNMSLLLQGLKEINYLPSITINGKMDEIVKEKLISLSLSLK